MKIIILTTFCFFSTNIILSQSATKKKDLKLTAISIEKKTEVIELETVNTDFLKSNSITPKENVLIDPKTSNIKNNKKK